VAFVECAFSSLGLHRVSPWIFMAHQSTDIASDPPPVDMLMN
jgi:hypothetical protein